MDWSYLHRTADGDVIVKQGETERQLPLVLCGPILRRVTRERVAVWLALKKPKTVTLRVFGTGADNSAQGQRAVGAETTVAVGRHLHLAVVEATVPEGQQLQPGRVYSYDCSFAPPVSGPVSPGTGPTLFGDRIVASDKQAAERLLTYRREESPSDVPSLPSFCLPPEDLQKVRLVHASCRKPHGESLDATDAVGEMIRSTVAQPTDRPHQLYLTGDQIYADDVADPLLAALIEVSKKIVWPEALPTQVEESVLEPGKRSDLVQEKAGFTGAYKEKPQYAKSHLVRAGEYFGMYLLAWSEVLWPESLPTFEDLDPAAYREWEQDRDAFEDWAARSQALEGRGARVPPPRVRHAGRAERIRQELADLRRFRESLAATRRTFANVPTYMLFDDHEITDDWNLNQLWCDRVYGTVLGRRILTNGLLAYALFQAWGNTPERFQGGSAGESILNAASEWTADDGLPKSTYDTLGSMLGLPPQTSSLFVGDAFGVSLPKAENAIDWHFQIEGPNYRVVWLDTRTRRAFGPEKLDPPALVNRQALQDQLPDGTEPRKPVTLVVSPAPVVGVPFLEDLQNEPVRKRQPETVFDRDVEAWSLNERAFEAFLGILAAAGTATDGSATRRSKIAFLSGDVHYSFAGRVQYWAIRPYGAAESATTEAVFAQLTSSSLKNETSGTRGTKTLHSGLVGSLGKGYRIFRNALPRPIRRFGWHRTERRAIGTLTSYYPSDPLGQVTIPWTVSGEPSVAEPLLQFSYQLTTEPDWRYRIDFVLGDHEVKRGEVPAARKPKPVPVQRPSGSDRWEKLRTYLSMAQNHREFTRQWGSGKELIGLNNVSELQFCLAGDEVDAIEQYCWWRLRGPDGNLLSVFPLTRYRVPMGYNVPAYPRPPNAEEL